MSAANATEGRKLEGSTREPRRPEWDTLDGVCGNYVSMATPLAPTTERESVCGGELLSEVMLNSNLVNFTTTRNVFMIHDVLLRCAGPSNISLVGLVAQVADQRPQGQPELISQVTLLPRQAVGNREGGSDF